jgi:DNA helicase-2/ATP-dependent DNA helicase PcrA
MVESPQVAERIQAYVDDPANVSAQQREAVLHPGNFFLTACPGSGKTRTVGVRVAYWASVEDPELERTRRIAATSYTNTAVREITAAAERAGHGASEPHFVGTLHRFLLRYVVRPFGRAVMAADQPPRLIVNHSGRKLDDEMIKIGRIQTHLPVWSFDWRADGTLTLREVPYELRDRYDRDELAQRGQERAREAKAALAKKGLLSMSDALYWAMRALEQPGVAEAIASRFDELVVDEVQDTTDVQQRCLRLLKQAGLHSIVYVGDMEQAIYGFAHANPVALADLIKQTTTQTLELDENWRSSQAICDVAYQFSERTKPDTAVGPNKDVAHQPELLDYDENNPQEAVERFAARLNELGIATEETVVLCRWGNTVSQLSGAPTVTPSRLLAPFLTGAAALQSGSQVDRETIRDIEGTIVAHAWPDDDLDQLNPVVRLDLRLRVMRLLEGLPAFDIKAKDWVKQAREKVKALVFELSDAPLDVTNRLKAPSGSGEMTMADVVGPPGAGPAIQTIHSVKGESHAATLLVAIDHPDMPSANTTSWIGRGDAEEVRVAYVALTRAQRYGAMAIPRSTPKAIREQYRARGFATPDDKPHQ